jgi:hypothetical protein
LFFVFCFSYYVGLISLFYILCWLPCCFVFHFSIFLLLFGFLVFFVAVLLFLLFYVSVCFGFILFFIGLCSDKVLVLFWLC